MAMAVTPVPGRTPSLLLGSCMPPRWHALIKLDPYYNFMNNQISEDKVCEGECDGEGDQVTNSAGKVSGLGGHHVWLIAVAVTSLYTLTRPGRGSHVPTAI